MLKERRLAMDLVTDQLFPAEQALDEAISAWAKLLDTMIVARKSANLSATVGQIAIEQNISTLVGLCNARASAVAAHSELSVVQRQIGLGAVATGGSGDKPQQFHNLHEVAA